MVSRNGKRSLRVGILAITALVLGLVAVPTTGNQPANAVMATAFDPGNIISDGEFYNGQALSATEVQQFLNQKVPNCLIGKQYTPGSTTPSGNIVANSCLKDFRVTTQSKAANAHCGAYSGVNGETAAQIIAKVGQLCGISQKVLLVMLEKEQSLITDDWPTTRMYNYAMGWGCPDSGPGNTANCDSSGAGFAYQVYQSAWQFKVYRANPNAFPRYKPFQTATIKWHPSDSCGTSQVYIQNWATSALYTYTPYRPNQAALQAGWGTGDNCSSYGNRNFYLFFNSWFGGSTPIGAFDYANISNGQLSVGGWAIDPDTTETVTVHVYVGSSIFGTLADKLRPDVGSAYPAFGSSRGYSWKASAGQWSGKQKVCVYGIDRAGNNGNVSFGCKELDFGGNRIPEGKLESAVVANGSLEVSGWAYDPDTNDPITVHVYVGQRAFGVIASGSRPDIAQNFPTAGSNRGFSLTLPAGDYSGSQQVCVFGINNGAGGNPQLGCRTVNFGGQEEKGRLPFGNLDYASVSDGVLSVGGWTIDPDTTEPITAHIYVDGRAYGVRAENARDDVATSYPGYGSNHGFALALDASQLNGRQEVCMYGINSVPGVNPRLGCKTVDFGGSQEQGRTPIGHLDVVAVQNGRLQVRGWALDPDTVEPITVHVYVGNSPFGVIADGLRPDVEAAYPSFGPNHGFAFEMPVDQAVGAQEVCVYGINSAPGVNPRLGCKTVVLG